MVTPVAARANPERSPEQRQPLVDRVREELGYVDDSPFAWGFGSPRRPRWVLPQALGILIAAEVHLYLDDVEEWLSS
jgi:hypothetical protein